MEVTIQPHNIAVPSWTAVLVGYGGVRWVNYCYYSDVFTLPSATLAQKNDCVLSTRKEKRGISEGSDKNEGQEGRRGTQSFLGRKGERREEDLI